MESGRGKLRALQAGTIPAWTYASRQCDVAASYGHCAYHETVPKPIEGVGTEMLSHIVSLYERFGPNTGGAVCRVTYHDASSSSDTHVGLGRRPH